MTLGMFDAAAEKLSDSFFEALADSPEEARLQKALADATTDT